jgi:ribonuclease P protein component
VQDCELVSADAPERSTAEPAAKAGTNFPRAARLLKHSDFERVYKQGKRHFSLHMTVFYLRQAQGASLDRASFDRAMLDGAFQEKFARIGFTVGRVLGGAVERNRIKRRLREAVRLRRASLGGVGPVDVVINPKKSVLALEFSVVLEEVGRAFDAIAKKLAQK